LNGHIGLIHALLPATVDLSVKVPDNHPSARNLGSERVGSGTIIDPNGYILTVHYVTVGASSIVVTMSDGEQLPAQIVAQDQETGLSLLKIAARELPFLKFGATDSVALGDPVVMVASSGQNGRRVSGGYVSSLAGYDGEWEYMIDKTFRLTAFNPGFGGGTLANFRGELIGVVSLNLNDVGKFSLAIPVEYYLAYAEELKRFGQVQSRPRRPWVGIYSQGMAGHVVVGGVVPNGPAAKFGIQQGDIILSVEKNEIRSRRDLYQEMWKKHPGERISFRILRDDQSFDLEVIGGDRADRYRT
jgi:S1-C subfamily serine protease